ncbi:hypothetical protein MLD38_024593 [Melastoma candidum]|uniref:Uncharacterized protein n=1 Tax=Melastoma candidum TaxID=119954 RepID=A0ACB9NZK2_9MYRT|nr:hypothetical protein MLD38_024593 [Melastoma candidum]
MGNIVSSAIMVPKELITQRMQAGAKGRSWQVESGSLEPIQSVCCGVLAGAISAMLTTLLDVVKTRLMTQVHGDTVNRVAAVMYTGVRSTMKQIFQEEGLVGFARGWGPRVVHSACFSALGYFAFETARLAILDQYIKRKEEAAEMGDAAST